jgi:hypothetical protein
MNKIIKSKSKTLKKKLKKISKIGDENIKMLVGGAQMQTPIKSFVDDDEEPTQQPITNNEEPTQQPITNIEEPTQQPITNIEEPTQQPITDIEEPTQQPITDIEESISKNIDVSSVGFEDVNSKVAIQHVGHQPVSIPDELLGLNTPPEPGIMDKMTDYFKLFADAFQYKMLLIVGELSGIKGKTPEEVSRELKQNTEKLKNLNEYFKNNPEVKEELQKTTDVVGEILSGSLKKIPDEFEESIDKLGKLAVKSGVDGLTEIPGANIPIATLKLGDDIAKISNESADVLKKTVNMIDDVLEETKEPIEDIVDKTKEIAVKAQEVNDSISTTSQLPQTQQLTTSQLPQTQQLTTSQLPQTQQLSQNGGGKMMIIGGTNKTFEALQTGGKKLRKRVNYTRNSFKRIAEKLTRKNR